MADGQQGNWKLPVKTKPIDIINTALKTNLYTKSRKQLNNMKVVKSLCRHADRLAKC